MGYQGGMFTLLIIKFGECQKKRKHWNLRAGFALRDCPARINRGQKWCQSIGFPLRMSRWNFLIIVFQPLSVHKHKTIKRYLIGIT